jgi:hypothetical protein
MLRTYNELLQSKAESQPQCSNWPAAAQTHFSILHVTLPAQLCFVNTSATHILYICTHTHMDDDAMSMVSVQHTTAASTPTHTQCPAAQLPSVNTNTSVHTLYSTQHPAHPAQHSNTPFHLQPQARRCVPRLPFHHSPTGPAW